MKRIFQILFVNIILIIAVLFCIEFITYAISDIGKHPFITPVYQLKSKNTNDNYEYLKNESYITTECLQYRHKYRRPVGLNYEKAPVLIFGGSFAWGARLFEEQTFHYKLSELMQRPVYNRALSSWGVQHMLYQLQRDDFYENMPKPEYIIFVYISNHIPRLYKYGYLCRWGLQRDYNYLKYNKTRKGLTEEKRLQNVPYSRLWNEYILKFIANYNTKNTQKTFALLEKHLLESKAAAEKHWGNIKFIILDYESESKDFNSNPEVLNEENTQKLIQDGFIVIKTSELTDIKLGEGYYLDNKDCHPNEKAWDIITPLFVERINSI